jgi:predicted ester cyclase
MSGLVESWLKLWNGDYSEAEALISSDFVIHAAMLDGGDGSGAGGPQGLVGWVGQTRAALPDLDFTVEVGPVVEDDHLALRWSARGTYAGGFPGAAAAAGTKVAFTGTDLLRVQHGQLAEYWVNSDMHVLLAQLQVSLR